MRPSWIKVGQRVKCIYWCRAQHQLGTITTVDDSYFTVEFDDPVFNTFDYRKWKYANSFEPVIPSTPEEIAKADKLRQSILELLQREQHADKYL